VGPPREDVSRALGGVGAPQSAFHSIMSDAEVFEQS
jgi:hypothetical protein